MAIQSGLMDFTRLMGLNSRLLFIKFPVICLWFFLMSGSSYGNEGDVLCLRSIKESLQDPNQILESTWNFRNTTDGFICSFTGIDCWHQNENRVLNIRLSSMGLKGSFALGIVNCSSLQLLDLSSNNLSGEIPSNISAIIPYVVNLDLSSNSFSGEIPVNLANCTYLNVLNLENNRLSGEIPPQLGQLSRIKKFSVANNLLVGPVPQFQNSTVNADSFANNPGLCGFPLGPCLTSSGKSKTGIIVGALVAGVIVGAIVVGLAIFFFTRKVSIKKKDDDPEGNKWAKSIKGTKKIRVSMFGDSVSKMRLSDLMKATDNFSKQNMIGDGRLGTIYRGKLENGDLYMVKRLQHTQHSEKEFMSEMATLGSVKHSDLVPLLGFCVAGKERLLVYKYMANGTLHDQLHEKAEEGLNSLEWPLRLKIAIGAARGLAWLHHSCNPRIIHRNISSKCILLDANYDSKISDFGLARLMNPIDTHLSTFVNGEFGDLGYVAPEYSRTLVATPKGDVYSFGVVLLELVTSESPTHVSKAPETFKGNLAEWVVEISRGSNLNEAIDKSLVGKGFDHEILQFLKVALNCVSLDPKERPSMFEVYQLLRAIGERYHFSIDAEITLPFDTGDVDNIKELIVARETTSYE